MRAAASTLEAEPIPVPPAASAPAPVPASPRYWAFLSYSHRDRAEAGRLHKALEAFTFPKDLVGGHGASGPVPARLHPVFRDQHELAASADLGGVIREALAESRTLVVMCSPAAARSRWVDEEVRAFRRLRPGAPVLAAIVAGEPGTGGPDECFPPALRGAEPVAADLRTDGDGRRLGRLKLAAGIVGLPLDALARREAQRRQRRLAVIAAASLAGMGVTSGLAIAAVQARDEAERQRGEAEGLVGFMLGDLRGRLEPLGRLDVLDAVGARALAYYAGQDKGVLTDDGLAQRSRALTLIGEIANLRGDLPAALRRYREALAGTGEALARAPDDPQRIFDHAQNVFWVGYIAWQRGQAREAESRFLEYKAMADRLVSLEPGKADWRLERLSADTNLGALLLQEGQPERASQAFESALREAEGLVSSAPSQRRYQTSLSEALAYLADAQRDSGRLEDALASRERQSAVLTRLADGGPGDAVVTRALATNHQALGNLFADRGEVAQALRHLAAASDKVEALRRTEPDNTEWLQVASSVQANRAELLLATGGVAAADPLIRASCDGARRLVQRDATVISWRVQRSGACLRLRAEASALRGHAEEGLALARQAAAMAADRGGSGARNAPWAIAALRIAGEQEAALGRRDAAVASWRAAIARVPQQSTKPQVRCERYLLLRRLGAEGAANATAAQLDAIGYRHPSYTRERRT